MRKRMLLIDETYEGPGLIIKALALTDIEVDVVTNLLTMSEAIESRSYGMIVVNPSMALMEPEKVLACIKRCIRRMPIPIITVENTWELKPGRSQYLHVQASFSREDITKLEFKKTLIDLMEKPYIPANTATNSSVTLTF